MRPSPIVSLIPFLLAGVTTALTATAQPAADALREGNRLFRSGRLEDAFEAYLAGWNASSPDPVLAYNLGTTAHHLDRLPEAILWYRRAGASLAGDRWLEDNLELARRRLDAPRLPPPGWLARLGRRRTELTAAAAAAAFLALVLALAERSRPHGGRLPELAAAAALALFVAGRALPAVAPREAVLLQPCVGVGGRLPAGSEVWVDETTPGGYTIRLDGGELTCPAGGIGLVED